MKSFTNKDFVLCCMRKCLWFMTADVLYKLLSCKLERWKLDITFPINMILIKQVCVQFWFGKSLYVVWNKIYFHPMTKDRKIIHIIIISSYGIQAVVIGDSTKDLVHLIYIIIKIPILVTFLKPFFRRNYFLGIYY